MDAIEDREDRRRGRRLTLSTENFDDYVVALMAKIRINVITDRLLSEDLQNPLVEFQRNNMVELQRLNIPWFSPAQLLADPTRTFQNFMRLLQERMLAAPAPVPAFVGLNDLQANNVRYRQAENHIYSTIVDTLRVGKTMHYARQCPFGAGQLLLQIIINDNRQETTRSLMAVFSALICLNLRDDESFEQFSRRIELIIQRLRN